MFVGNPLKLELKKECSLMLIANRDLFVKRMKLGCCEKRFYLTGSGFPTILIVRRVSIEFESRNKITCIKNEGYKLNHQQIT